MTSDPSTAPAMRASPFCVHLASKKAYFLRAPPLEDADLLDGSGHCWCRKTMQALGPDGEVADPAECRSGRACFESSL